MLRDYITEALITVTTWIEGILPDFPFHIQDMDFFDANIGYAVGWGGQAFRSADGGVTWQVLPTPNAR